MCTPSPESNRVGRFLRFNLGARVCPAHALHDKIEISFELGSIPCHGDYFLFLQRLCVPPLRERASRNNLSSYGTYFNRPSRMDERCFKLTVRERPLAFRDGTSINRPHFAGMLAIRYSGRPQRAYLTAKLTLNPIRYLHQATTHLTMADLAEGRTATFNPIQTDARPSDDSATGEFALHEWNNWIPAGRRWRMIAGSGCFNRHFQSYLTGVQRILHTEVTEAANQATVTLMEARARQRVTIKRVETNWEFFDENAIRTMQELRPHLRLFPHVQAPDHNSTEASENPYPSFIYQTRVNEKIRLYAKTNRRIRVEVVHFLAGENGFQGVEARSFPSIEDSFGLFSMLAEQAAEKVNEFFSQLNRVIHFSFNRTPLDLLCRISEACNGDNEKAQEVLHLLLLCEGGQTNRESGIATAYGSVLRHMASVGVLISVQNRYILSGEYRSALRILRELPNRYELEGRIRRRRHSFISDQISS